MKIKESINMILDQELRSSVDVSPEDARKVRASILASFEKYERGVKILTVTGVSAFFKELRNDGLASKLLSNQIKIT